jgi:hypothetical protein
VLAHWDNSLQVDMSLHLETLSWFRANHSLLFLLDAVRLAEKQQIYSLWLDPIRARTQDLWAPKTSTLNPRSTGTWDEHAEPKIYGHLRWACWTQDLRAPETSMLNPRSMGTQDEHAEPKIYGHLRRACWTQDIRTPEMSTMNPRSTGTWDEHAEPKTSTWDEHANHYTTNVVLLRIEEISFHNNNLIHN